VVDQPTSADTPMTRDAGDPLGGAIPPAAVPPGAAPAVEAPDHRGERGPVDSAPGSRGPAVPRPSGNEAARQLRVPAAAGVLALVGLAAPFAERPSKADDDDSRAEVGARKSA
jgi:hypothetical protein